VKNGSEKVKFGLKVSTDGGTFSYFKNNADKTQVDIKKNEEVTFIYNNIPANSRIQFNMLATSNSAYCYLDNIAATFPDNDIPTDIGATLTGNGRGTADNAVYNLAGQRVDSNFKGLVIKNGIKFMSK
jgi:hypothetical protein